MDAKPFHLPWVYQPEGSNPETAYRSRIRDASGHTVADDDGFTPGAEEMQFIVECVNGYAELVACLRRLVGAAVRPHDEQPAREAGMALLLRLDQARSEA